MHHESIEKNDPVWDCTLIKVMRDKGDTVVNPIYHWTDEDIWVYVRENKIKMNPLYEKGYRRVGCIGCPLATYREKQKAFHDYPQYKDNYIKAFDKMLKAREASGKKNLGNDWHWWETGEDVFMWWLEEYKRNVKGQITIEEWLSDHGNDRKER